MKYLYNIKATNDLSIYSKEELKRLRDKDRYLESNFCGNYNENLSFYNKPTQRDVLIVLGLLKPDWTFIEESIEITLLRELKEQEY